ncbi:MAG: hypothetical protein QMC98_02765 [Candidatus Thermoplasmatota archaeon]|nr:hypothetical protein [Candidatus Thermoplasmatota archaeon]
MTLQYINLWVICKEEACCNLARQCLVAPVFPLPISSTPHAQLLSTLE